MFDPLYQPSPTKLSMLNQGIGNKRLVICKKICESLGGGIQVESTDRLGTVFTFGMEVLYYWQNLLLDQAYESED